MVIMDIAVDAGTNVMSAMEGEKKGSSCYQMSGDE